MTPFEWLVVGFWVGNLGIGLFLLWRDRGFRHKHVWQTVHHFGEDGKHWCPTGFQTCTKCHEFEPHAEMTCFLWGRYDRDALGRSR